MKIRKNQLGYSKILPIGQKQAGAKAGEWRFIAKADKEYKDSRLPDLSGPQVAESEIGVPVVIFHLHSPTRFQKHSPRYGDFSLPM